MAHPVIEEINRVFSVDRIQTHAFRRWQRVLRDEVQPLLDELERLKAAQVTLTDPQPIEPEVEDIVFGETELVPAEETKVKRGRK